MAGNEMKTKKPEQKAKKKNKVAKFFREFIGEVKKLSWATPKEIASSSLTVFAVVAMFAVLMGVLDTVFGFCFTLLANLG